MDFILDYAINKISIHNKADDFDKELVRYGLEILLIRSIYTICSIVISAVFGCFWECIVFLMAFSAIRTSAGGYHAKTRVQCFLMSMVMIIINISIVKLVTHYIPIYYAMIPLALMSGVVIWYLSPVDTENRPLEHDEKIRFKKRARFILCLELLSVIIMEILNLRITTSVIMLATIFMAILLIMELIMKRKNNE